jgi:hypothetical protein
MAAQSKALKNYKEQCKRRQANLLDPSFGGSNAARAFPQWYPGMLTSEYVRRFQALSPMKECGYIYSFSHVAPMLDIYSPEVVDESDAGGVYQ